MYNYYIWEFRLVFNDFLKTCLNYYSSGLFNMHSFVKQEQVQKKQGCYLEAIH